MGLALEVGFLASLKENDDEGYLEFKKEFDRLNHALKKAGLPIHSEPEECEC